MLTVLTELIILEEKHSIKADISDIDKTNESSLYKSGTQNAFLYQTLVLKGLKNHTYMFKSHTCKLSLYSIIWSVVLSFTVHMILLKRYRIPEN